jgi:hypothetical protein
MASAIPAASSRIRRNCRPSERVVHGPRGCSVRASRIAWICEARTCSSYCGQILWMNWPSVLLDPLPVVPVDPDLPAARADRQQAVELLDAAHGRLELPNAVGEPAPELHDPHRDDEPRARLIVVEGLSHVVVGSRLQTRHNVRPLRVGRQQVRYGGVGLPLEKAATEHRGRGVVVHNQDPLALGMPAEPLSRRESVRPHDRIATAHGQGAVSRHLKCYRAEGPAPFVM